jgi:glycosyltransferase involved in cell wall biosynthesis
MPRILVLTDDLGGGTGNHVASLARRWDRSGWPARIVTTGRPAVRAVSGLSLRHVSSAGAWDRFPVAQLRRLLIASAEVRTRRPDLVHTYFFWSILSGRALKKLRRIRVLVENREDMGFAWGPWEYRLLKRGRSLPDRVVCVSEAVRETVLKREGLEPHRVTVIHNGVEPLPEGTRARDELRAELHFAPEHRVVGLVANLNRPVKGVSHFLRAIPRIAEAVPDARFVIVGEGALESDLRAEADALGVSQRVVFAGYRENVNDYYATMDVSVLTSLSEGLSLTLLESMRQGLPVVATRVGGNPELVVHGETGFLVRPGDTEAFSQSVIRLLGDADLRERLGAAGRRLVHERFMLPDIAERYLRLYRTLLDSAEEPGPGVSP